MNLPYKVTIDGEELPLILDRVEVIDGRLTAFVHVERPIKHVEVLFSVTEWGEA